MATQMIAKALVMKALGILLPGAGGFNAATTALGAGGGSVGGIGTFGPNFGFPGFANGGILPANGPAIVGENGPEFAFSSGGQTTIVPMDDAFNAARSAMTGSLTSAAAAADDASAFGPDGGAVYNSSSANSAFADNRSSINNTKSVYQSSAEQNSYQEAVSAVMGSSGSMVIETQIINEQEFATIDQVEKAAQASAQQARAEVFAEMQNSVGLRKRIGI